jgi:hypothetical protein
MLSLLLGLVLLQAAPSAETLKITEPAVIAELDAGKLKGEPWRLAWSPDARELYVQAVERDGRGVVKTTRHYVLAVEGGSPKEVEGEPAWAAKYWAWKSWKATPAAGAPFEIALDERREVLRATAAPKGGSLAGMSGDPSSGAPVGGGGPGGAGGGTVSVGEGQNAVIRTMKLKGEVIGEWVNAGIVPGLTFGWAPAPLRMIAFSGKDEDVVIMDDQGRKQKIETKAVTRLPAWSDDGRKVAFLEQNDRKKFTVQFVVVTPGS